MPNIIQNSCKDVILFQQPCQAHLLVYVRKNLMGRCSVSGCNNKSDRAPIGITFHWFPQDENLKEKWIEALGRKGWTPGRFSYVCSNHFEESDLDRTSLSKVRLKEGVIPSIFPYPSIKHKEELQVLPSQTEERKLEVNNYSSEKFQPQVVIQRLPESTVNKYLSCNQDFVALGSHRRKRTIPYFQNSLCQLQGKSKCLYCCTSQTNIKCGKKSAHKRQTILKYFPKITASVSSHQKKGKLFKTVLKNSLSGMMSKHKFMRKRKRTEANSAGMKSNLVDKPELQTNGRIATIHPELFRELNEILSTVEDAVIAETKLLTKVENAVLAKSKHSFSNYLQDEELRRHENSGIDLISPDCIKKEPEEYDISMSNSPYIESVIKSSEDFHDSSDEVSVDIQKFQQDSDSNSCIISEKSSNSTTEIWPTPRIVSVSSIASEDIQEPIFDEKMYGYVKDVALKMTELSEKKSNCLSENHSDLPIKSNSELEQSTVMCNMQNSLLKLENVLATVLQLKKDGTNCKHKEKAHTYEENNNLFDKFSLIIKDSKEGSEHYNVNAKHILDLISNYL